MLLIIRYELNTVNVILKHAFFSELKAFVRFLTGCTTLSATGVSRRCIEASFTSDGAIFSSTCLLTLQLPESVESYEHLENALRAVMSDGLFNIV